MRRHLVLIAVVLLAGCASRPEPLAMAVAAPPPVAAAPTSPPAPTPINAGLSPAATLWHLRAGLNVAALACRGAEAGALTQGYNALLAREADRLRAAEASYAAEYQQTGGAWRQRYDDDMTRLYNFWGQSRGREALCAGAAAAVSDPMLTDDAAARLAALDHAFAPPWLAVDARIFGGATVQVAAR